MAIVFSDNVIEIAVIQSHAGRPVVNVWHMSHTQELTGGDKESVVRDFANNWQDHILDIQVQELDLIEFQWRSLDPGDSTVGTLSPDPAKSISGQNTAPPASPNVALLVEKRTNNRPRGRSDGRCYLAGVGEGFIDAAGALTPAMVTLANSTLAAFYNGISDSGTVVGGWDGDSFPVVLETTAASRAPGTQPVTINSRRVTSLVIDPVAATQRERMRN